MQILSGLDIYARVGSNRPLVLLDARANIIEGSALSVRFQSVVGSPILWNLHSEGIPAFGFRNQMADGRKF